MSALENTYKWNVLLAQRGRCSSGFIYHVKTTAGRQFCSFFRNCGEISGWLYVELKLFQTRNQMKKNEAVVSNITKCFTAGPRIWEGDTNWRRYSIDCTLARLSPIQYLITFGVNRLNGDNGQCVLTIRQSTYRKKKKGQRSFLILSIDSKRFI